MTNKTSPSDTFAQGWSYCLAIFLENNTSRERRKGKPIDNNTHMHNQASKIKQVQFCHSVLSDSLRPHESQMPGLPVHHQLPKFTHTHSHRVSDAIQPSHPQSSPFPPAPMQYYVYAKLKLLIYLSPLLFPFGKNKFVLKVCESVS